MKKILIIITLALLVLSCNKEKTCSSLTLGDYYGKFTFNSDGIIKTDSSIEISQITDNSIIINGSELLRSVCKVDGSIQYLDLMYQGGPVEIHGEITKEKKQHYIISGSFIALDMWARPHPGKFTMDLQD